MDRKSFRCSKNADVVVFNKGGRDSRIELMAQGEEVPREFFYGFLDLEKAGISAAMMSSAGPVAGFAGGISDLVERTIARLTRLGVRPLSARIASGWLPGAKVVMSYTDGFSLSLGLGFPRGRGRATLIGGFQGLCDIELRAPCAMQWLVRRIITRALSRLDHVFFLSPADRVRAIEIYGIVPERSSLLTFGVDTEFWRPMPVQGKDFVLAIGQDLNRDFDLLARSPGANPTLIITRNPVCVPPGASHIRISPGGYSDPLSATDKDLRCLYNTATAVVVPLKDVYQPSGQSVTLQAMSCGRPTVLSKTRGIWALDLLKDGVNCILVPPGDAAALGVAIGRIRGDRAFARRLGQAARETAVAHFGLDKIGAGTVSLAQLGLGLWLERNNTGPAIRLPGIA